MWTVLKRSGDVLMVLACLTMIAVGAVQLRDRLLATPPSAGVVGAGGGMAEPVANKVIGHLDQATRRGPANARIALIEFSDFQCPYCGQYARETYPRIEDQFLKSGQIAYMFFNLPLEQAHPFALRAGTAAECAGRQSKFWDMHDVLFKNQGKLDGPALIEHAGSIGLRMPEFETCLSDSQSAARIRSEMNEAKALEVAGTPTLFVAELQSATEARALYRIRGAASFDVIANAVKSAMGDDRKH